MTVPQEFHFATDERIPPTPTNFDDLFDKVLIIFLFELLAYLTTSPVSHCFVPYFQLSLNSESQNDKTIPRNTIPNPFHLYTEVCLG